jgi:DnaJ-domain-containing protein 1
MECPADLLVQEMRAMNPTTTTLTQFYRKLIKQLHPDKNGHPRAKEAFHKVQEAYTSVKALIPDSRSYADGSCG